MPRARKSAAESVGTCKCSLDQIMESFQYLFSTSQSRAESAAREHQLRTELRAELPEPRSGSRPGALQEGQQVGELLARQLLGKAGRHQRDRAWLDVGDVGARNATFVAIHEYQHDGVAFALEHTGHGVPRRGRHDDRLEAARKARVRKDDGLEQIALAADLPNRGQVGADGAATVADRVT